MGEYHNIVDSKRWEPTDIKETSHDEHLTLEFSTGSTEESVIKTANKSDFKIHRGGKDNDSFGE